MHIAATNCDKEHCIWRGRAINRAQIHDDYLDIGTASLELGIGEVGSQLEDAGAMLVDYVARVCEDQRGGFDLNLQCLAVTSVKVMHSKRLGNQASVNPFVN